MRTININLEDLSSQTLDIGYMGESHHVQVYIHCASFFKAYPDATAAMVAEPPEGDLYPVNLTRDSSTLIWTILDSDLVNAGSGKFQITFTQGSEIIKTAYGSFSVSASIVANGEAPEPIEDWMLEAQQVLNDLESFDDISASATTLSAGSSATASITEVDGHKNISIGIPKGDTGAGITPDISIGTVETLEPSESAYVELDETSTAEAPVLNFGIPQGETGSIDDAYATTIPMSSSDSTKISAAIGAKLDANQGSGNSGKFMKVGVDGSVVPAEVDMSGKADKVSSATSGNFAGLDSNGNLTDSGSKASDFATAADTVLSTTLSRGRMSSTTVGTGSFAFGSSVTASGSYSHAEGDSTSASGVGSHAEGYGTRAQSQYSHAEGYNSTASAYYAHAEGFNSTASGKYSHAEGQATTASAELSHAEGFTSVASGKYSHAQGYYTSASGINSHAEGNHTNAQRQSQHAGGEYNVADSTGSATTRGSYVEIIGNGTADNARSNARTLDWDGNERLKGDLYVGCNSDSSGGTKVLVVPFVGSTSSTAGSIGLVPAPTSANRTDFLRGDGTWASVDSATDMTGATSSSAGTHGLVPAPSAGDQDKVLKGDGTWGDAASGMIMPSSAISIPSYGTPVTYNMTGITANHQLIRWNFSASAENSPPVDLEWSTADGSFTITNAGGTTSETIQPVFAEVTGVTATVAT